MKIDKLDYLRLFTSLFKISTFTFGGGFVMIPLMKKKFVNDLDWIKEDEMLDIAALAQSSPGAIAVNAAILLGYKVAGLTGALISIFAMILPPFIIISVISLFYTAFSNNIVIRAILKGMQAGIAAVVLDVAIGMASNVIKTKKAISILVMIGAFIAIFFFDISLIIIMLISGGIGIATTLYRIKHGKDVA